MYCDPTCAMSASRGVQSVYALACRQTAQGKHSPFRESCCPARLFRGMIGRGNSGVMVVCLLPSAGLAGQMTGMTGRGVRPGSTGSTVGAATMREIMGHAPGAMSGPCPRLQPQPGMPDCVGWPLGLPWTRSGVPTFLQVKFTHCRCVTCFRALLLSLLFSRAAEVHRAPSPALLSADVHQNALWAPCSVLLSCG